MVSQAGVCSPGATCSLAVVNLTTGEGACHNEFQAAYAYSSIKWTMLATAYDLGLNGESSSQLNLCHDFPSTARLVIHESNNLATACLLSYIGLQKFGARPSSSVDHQSIDFVNQFLQDKVGLTPASQLCNWGYNNDYLHQSSAYPAGCPANLMTAADAVKFLSWVWDNQLKDSPWMQSLFPSYNQSFFNGARNSKRVFHKVGHDGGVTTWNDLGLIQLNNDQVIAIALFNRHATDTLAAGKSVKAAYVACALTQYFTGAINPHAGCSSW